MRPLDSLYALGFAVVVLTKGASASENFPNVVKSELHLAKLPDCTLCHDTNKGGENTARKPFARTMQRFGVVKKNDGSLIAALQRADAEGTDSDGDCVPDTDELRAGTDPNVFNAGDGGLTCAPQEQPPLMETGCSVTPRGSSTSLALVLVASSLYLARRRSLTDSRRRVTSCVRAGNAMNDDPLTVVSNH